MIEFINLYCYRSNKSLNSNIKNKDWWIKHNALNYYDEILLLTSFLTPDAMWSERIFNILSNSTCCPVCVCGNSIEWNTSASKYLTYCSKSCGSKYSYDKRKLTNQLTYGIKNPAQSVVVKSKARDTNIVKYGADNPSKNTDVKNKVKETFKKNYVEGHPQRNSSIRQKVKDTCQLIFNSDSPLESISVREKIKDTMLIKYGVEHALQSEEILNKQKITMIDRFGVENFNQTHLSKEQIALRETISATTDFSLLGLSTSHTYKVIKEAGIILESSRSLQEIEVYNYVCDLVGREILKNTKIDGVEFDMYDDVMKIAIEFNGVYWHSENNGKDSSYHLKKTKLAAKHGIKLIHIFSSEWELSREIVKSRLCNMFGQSKRIFARNCTIELISSAVQKQFFEASHLQGNVSSSVAYGLFLDNKLVAAMSFSKPRYKKDIAWELLRYSVICGYTIVGGPGKLLKHFCRSHSGNIISYSDMRWGNGNVYEKIGFTKTHETGPGFYYTKNGTLENRLKYQKHKLQDFPNYSSDKTATTIMAENGFSKIWDCGNSVYLLSNML